MPAGGGLRFSRRGVPGGVGFFCRVGLQEQFELGRVERLALLAEELAQDMVDLAAQQLVLLAQRCDLGIAGSDHVEQFLFAPGAHLLGT